MSEGARVEDWLEQLLLILADMDVSDDDEVDLRDFIPETADTARLDGLATVLTGGELRRRIRLLRALR